MANVIATCSWLTASAANRKAVLFEPEMVVIMVTIMTRRLSSRCADATSACFTSTARGSVKWFTGRRWDTQANVDVKSEPRHAIAPESALLRRHETAYASSYVEKLAKLEAELAATREEV